MIPYNQQSYFAPYLSDTVMQSVIENENVLNNALLRDVLVANPQSAKSDDLMQAVDDRINPMPDYMQEEIEAGAYVISAKEQLENNLAMARSEADGWYHRMVGDMLNDTAGIDAEALQALFESRPSPSNAYFRAMQLLESGDSLAGFEVLADIPSTFDYNQGQLAEYTLMVEKLAILHPILFSGIPVTVADSLTVANLIELYCIGEPSGNSWLRNTLVALDKIDFIEEYILPDNLKSTEATIPEKKSVSYELMLKVFPNPAKDYIIIEYHAAKAGSSVIQLSDALGRPVDRISVSKESDQITYITTKLQTGLYTCSFWIEGKNKATVKFNVVR